ncbi:helix-turn-helix domain-containing protein [Streptomyces sp. ID38640]|uniref:bifunctional transcriptional activator/DNA repair enzyme AdaA n=1 Tax=Streptomyces sp. ID38640 TaxID=1265399 RepID=UPI00140ED2F5|nr:AlkA N-terminal domain-containing protein [Streptomyces sp. ID38640]QIK05923.1 helix-turn-helix domain-containing protein [Streptomyces sp. ID38640]
MRDDEARYEAVTSRDARFDGEFFFAVVTTGIYCRPSCPAVTPKRVNVRFFPSAAAAQAAGFRACRRCRPDAVPGSAEWNVRADLVGRAVRLIGDGVVDREGVGGLARRLGYSPRQVQRQLTAELGAGPVALARARRAHTARVLLQTTALPVTELAFAAGFASIRQFNDTIREIYAGTPSELRAAAGNGGAAARRTPAAAPGAGARRPGDGFADRSADRSAPVGIPLRLAHRGPYAAAEIFDFLQLRAVPGVEEIRGTRGERTYRRTLRLTHGSGIAEVDEPAGPRRRRRPPAGLVCPAARGTDGGWLECRLRLTDLRDLSTAVQRLRRLFDLDADPYAVAERLGADPLLGPLVAERPGLRSPGAADPEELAVRTVLGGPPEHAAALVRRYGKPLDAADGGLTHLFPAPGNLTGAEVEEPVRALCTALADGTLTLDAGADRGAAERALAALPGVGPRAAAYLRMRALGDPDVGTTPGWGQERGAVAGPAAWRPWGAYALHHLWRAGLLPAGEMPEPDETPGSDEKPRSDEEPGAGEPSGAGEMPGVGESSRAGEMPGVGESSGAGEMPGAGESSGAAAKPPIYATAGGAG